MSDHMLVIDWSHDQGWDAPRILPYQPLQLDPASSSLHYGLECFEGMKAYVDDSNNVAMFPTRHEYEANEYSAHRLLLPTIDGEEFIQCIQAFVRVERDWIPKGFGYALYLRPTLISTHPYLGVSPSTACKLYVIASPVGPYYPTGFAPIKLFADPHTHVQGPAARARPRWAATTLWASDRRTRRVRRATVRSCGCSVRTTR